MTLQHVVPDAPFVNGKCPIGAENSTLATDGAPQGAAPFMVRDPAATVPDAPRKPQGRPGKPVASSGRGKPGSKGHGQRAASAKDGNGRAVKALGNGHDPAKAQETGKTANHGLRPFSAHALELLALGYSPLPIEPATKRPAAILHGGSDDWEPWSDYCATPLDTDAISLLASDRKAYGLGLACGYGGLIAIDIDTDDAEIVAAIHAVLPSLTIGKRGAKGATWFFRDPTAKIAARAFKSANGGSLVDVLASGRQTVIPPTMHPETGAPYAWISERTVLDMPLAELPIITAGQIAALEAALTPWLAQPKPAKDGAPIRPKGARFKHGERKRYETWAQAALAGETAKGRGKTAGRNDALYGAACALGKHVHHGLLSEREVTAALMTACETNGLAKDEGRRACLATIASGLHMACNDGLPELPDRPLAKVKTANHGADGDAAKSETVAEEPERQPPLGRGAQPDGDEAAIDRLARLRELEYERIRSDEAAAIGIGRVAMLDKLVAARRKEFAREQAEADEAAAAGEPWPEPVDGAALLTELRQRIAHHAVLPEHGAVTVAAWCALAHAFDAFRVVPMLAFESPEPGCGKSTLMEIVSYLAPAPILASNISPAALFRVIDLKKPTLLIDEADTFVNLNEELRGVLNSGHARSTAYVWRCEGEGADLAPRQFSTWCPKAVALIGELPATLQARSIVIRLRRKLSSERVAKIKVADEAAFLELRRKLARWANDHAQALSHAEPVMPAGLANRVEDNWAPLVAIANAAGGDWPKEIRAASVATVGLAAEFDEPSAAVRLLADMRDMFDRHGDRIGSQPMVNHLVQIEDAPWGAWSHGKPITTRRVVTLLKDFGVKPRQDKHGSHWRRSDCEDTWTRYLPFGDAQTSAPPVLSAIVPPNQQRRAFAAIASATACPGGWHLESAETPANTGIGGTMTLAKGGEAHSRAKWINGDDASDGGGGRNFGRADAADAIFSPSSGGDASPDDMIEVLP